MTPKQLIDAGYTMANAHKPIREAALFFGAAPKGYTKTYREMGLYLINLGVYLDTKNQEYREIADDILRRLPQYGKDRLSRLLYSRED